GERLKHVQPSTIAGTPFLSVQDFMCYKKIQFTHTSLIYSSIQNQAKAIVAKAIVRLGPNGPSLFYF
ncbi:hypothetical protein, partial [Bacteroides faecis]|uniref:hypothetical protein n=2 Tax=Bacteroides faecis TaxID=674529 RepID=UPI000262D489